jgi:hypothetical protein
MRRFVVLTHDWPCWHWDFMLEEEEGLRTWRLDGPPHSAGGITALPLEPHRLAYLDYEGPVSGARGTVKRWDRGEYEVLEAAPLHLLIALRGARLQGTARLDNEGHGGWRYHFAPAAGGHQAKI